MPDEIVFLRSCEPERVLQLPLGDGRCRVLGPGVTTAVPAAVLALPTIAQLLHHRRVSRLDSSRGWDADARQDWAERTDMTAQIRAAEQRQFATLLRQLPERDERCTSGAPYGLLVAAARTAGLPSAGLRALLNGAGTLPAELARLGLSRPSAPPAGLSGHALWRRRHRAAQALLAGVQRRQEIADPADAAAWLIAVLAGALPPAVRPLRQASTAATKRWPPERIAVLRQRWAMDVPAPQIAAEFGCSPGAVLGKALRLGLPGRHGRPGKHSLTVTPPIEPVSELASCMAST